jgi:hypothetical protein
VDLNPRLLAFLEHEMKKVKNDKSRPSEDRHHASSVLGRIEGELEWEEEQNTNNGPTEELFS